MRARIDRLDAVLYTHGHADHILGLDDIRPFNMKQRGAVPIYASADTLAILRRQFAYIFDEAPAGEHSCRWSTLHTIDGPFELFGAQIVPVPAMHGSQPVLGFRIGKVAYLTDFSRCRKARKRCSAGSTISFWTRCATCRTRRIRTSSNRWRWSRN